MCLGGWGRGCGISFVFAARFELHTLTMEQAADAGWKTELFWTQWNTKNIHSDLITESGRVRAHCSCWRWKFWRKKVLCFNPSCIFKLKVSLPIIIIIILFLRQVQFPLTNRLFITVIRNEQKDDSLKDKVSLSSRQNKALKPLIYCKTGSLNTIQGRMLLYI